MSYLTLVYQARLSDIIGLEMKYNSANNDSNDSIDFNAFTSNSYSSYSRDVFDISLKIAF
jgi:hypothetical protein